ncbi:Glycosyl hydrolase family 38 protein [Aphelenchoides bicaudatus]|nr:Glycosyl hydrolase family 38 protein [Aphelenchoides bicaudatus]
MIPNNRLMPSPRLFITVGLSIFVFVSFLLYASVDTNAKLRQDIYSNVSRSNNQFVNNESTNSKNSLKRTTKSFPGIDKQIVAEKNHQPERVHPHPKDIHQQVPEPVADKPNEAEGVGVVRKPVTFKSVSDGVCAAKSAKTDVQMLDAYVQLPFDNPDGGAWKQGFDIQYDKQKIKEEKTLEVVVIPHSHCDPGWLRTFEEYYDAQTQHILNGMLKHLDSKKDMKFIYAEMSFFEYWWAKLNGRTERKDKRFSSLRSIRRL